jgi:nucleotide-binding universal stress UspA family protein
MGTGGIGRMRRALIGSVANQLMDAAACDVLVVPRGSVSVQRQARAPA